MFGFDDSHCLRMGTRGLGRLANDRFAPRAAVPKNADSWNKNKICQKAEVGFASFNQLASTSK